MPYEETNDRELTCSDSRSATFCIVVWDEGDFPEMPQCTEMFNGALTSGGGNDDIRAYSYAKSILPTVRFMDDGLCQDALFLTSFTVKEIGCTGKWKVTANYTEYQTNSLSVCKVSFSVGGTQITIKQAKEHIASYFNCSTSNPACSDGSQPTLICPPGTSPDQLGVCRDPNGVPRDKIIGCADGSSVSIPGLVCKPSGTPPIYGCAFPYVLGPDGLCHLGTSVRQPTPRCQGVETLGTTENPCNNNPFSGAINVNGNSVEGTNIFGKGMEFTLTSCLPRAFVDCNFVQNLYDMAPSFNDAPFCCFAAGEVLFKGASGSDQNSTVCVDYSFCVSPNEYNIQPAGCITIPFVLGWDYLWYRYQPVALDACHMIVMEPHSAHVERVYCPKSFDRLQLPCC